MIGRVKLIAAARFVHDGRRLFAGERFEASELEAADLVAIRFASRVREDDAVVGIAAQREPPQGQIEDEPLAQEERLDASAHNRKSKRRRAAALRGGQA